MKSRFITINAILLFLLVTGFSFAQYYSGKTFEKKEISNNEFSSKTNEQNLIRKEEGSQDCASLQDEFQEALCRLKCFREKGSLDELIIEWNKIEQDWSKLGGDSYGNLTLEFLSVLTSARFRSADDKALNLSQSYAIQTLKKADTFDFEIEWQLLIKLRYSISESKLSDVQIQERRERVKLWLHLIHRLEVEKDKNFDPNDLPLLNVTPPEGVPVRFSGMSPDLIKDPQLRAEYEKAIEANAKKMKYYNHQYKLRQNEDFFVRYATKYISMVYSRPPIDLNELKNLLNEYQIPENMQKLIKEKLQSNIIENP